MGNEIFIRPSRDVRTNYAEISRLCKKHPVAVTVNGREDSVIMSHEQYNELQSELSSMKERLQMYAVLANAEDDVKMGRVACDRRRIVFYAFPDRHRRLETA